jgi:nucleoid DNA-binding protein
VIKIDIINAAAKAAGVDRQRGFGVFLVKPRKSGIGRNPKRPTEEMQIPPGFTIRFKPGKELRDMTVLPEKPAMKAASASPRTSGTSS